MLFVIQYGVSCPKPCVLRWSFVLIVLLGWTSWANAQAKAPDDPSKLRNSNSTVILTELEFLAPVDKAKRPSAARDFKVFDGNQDKLLSLEERRQIPSRNSWEVRLAPTDPVMRFSTRLKVTVAAVLKAADKNSDTRLDASEFEQSAFQRTVPGLEQTQFRDWDRDRNGSVSLAETQRVVDAATGVSRLDGANYREPSGIVHFAMLYTYADENHDDKLSRAEYLERGYGGPGANGTFDAADKDHDQFVTFQEFVGFPIWNQDPISDFLKFDVDLDGQLSKSELLQGVPEYQRPLASTFLPAFDTDRNQHLSLDEYRFTPVANMIAIWHELPRDADADGRLSNSEFYQFPTLELRALSRQYFQLFDLNSDGYLDLTEAVFNVDLPRVTASVAFAYLDKDRNQSLTLNEAQADLTALSKNSKDPAIQTQLSNIRNTFVTADKNGDQLLTQQEAESEFGKAVFRAAGMKPVLAKEAVKPIPAKPAQGKTVYVEPPVTTPIPNNSAASDQAAPRPPIITRRVIVLVLLNLVIFAGAVWFFIFRRSSI
jgi:Ca2+-binding EF-hand superfamily protein